MTDGTIAPEFVHLSDAVPDILQEIRYFSGYNFVGARVDGYEAPVALGTHEMAAALIKVNDRAAKAGMILKVYDAYRPQRAVDHFVRWAEDISDTRMKDVFYPEVDKKDLFRLGFIAARSGHSRGSTVDLTLVDRLTGRELDMGGAFDYFGALSHPDHPGVTERQHENRMLLRRLMTACGFRPLSTEWWHFTLENEPYPDTVFDFPVR